MRTESSRQKVVGRKKTGFSCLLPIAFCLLVILSSGVAFACPSCKTTAASSENPAAEAKMARGWARSITLLMWTPYLLFGGVTFAIVRSARQKK